MQGKKAEITWSQLDHAQVTVTLQIEVEVHKKRIYKDWVLTQPDFIAQAQNKGHFTRPFTARTHDSPRKEWEHYRK